MFRYNHEAQRKDIWKARDFENEVKKITGARFAHAVSSGSTAVSCAPAAAGVGAGDEVIVPPLYIASVEAVIFAGGIPVFAEIDETLCLSAEGIRKAITPKTKAVVLVHMCGQMANMDEIIKVVKEHNLVLVEDAGQAFSATYKGTSVGLFGKPAAILSIFSRLPLPAKVACSSPMTNNVTNLPIASAIMATTMLAVTAAWNSIRCWVSITASANCMQP